MVIQTFGQTLLGIADISFEEEKQTEKRIYPRKPNCDLSRVIALTRNGRVILFQKLDRCEQFRQCSPLTLASRAKHKDDSRKYISAIWQSAFLFAFVKSIPKKHQITRAHNADRQVSLIQLTI